MSRLQLSSREKSIVAFLVLLFLGYGIYVGLYIPWVERGDYLKSRISLKEKDLKMTLMTIKKSQDLEAKYQNVLNDYKQKTSDEEVMSSILSEIQQVASLMNVHISDLKPKKVQNVDFYNKFTVSMSVSGTLVDTIHFIHTLEGNPHRLNIDELQLSKKSARDDSLICKIIFSRLLFP